MWGNSRVGRAEKNYSPRVPTPSILISNADLHRRSFKGIPRPFNALLARMNKKWLCRGQKWHNRGFRFLIEVFIAIQGDLPYPPAVSNFAAGKSRCDIHQEDFFLLLYDKSQGDYK